MTATENGTENGNAEVAPLTKRKPLKLVIGHLTEKNLGQLKMLNKSTFPVSYQEQFYTDLFKSLEYCRLGFYNDIVVSSICCRLEDRAEGLPGKALYIMTLSVLPPYQKLSMASQLIQFALDKAESKEAQADEVQEMYLHVQTSNTSAMAFYRSFGFEIAEVIEDYYTDIEPSSCNVLRKPLNGGTISPPCGA